MVIMIDFVVNPSVVDCSGLDLLIMELTVIGSVVYAVEYLIVTAYDHSDDVVVKDAYFDSLFVVKFEDSVGDVLILSCSLRCLRASNSLVASNNWGRHFVGGIKSL